MRSWLLCLLALVWGCLNGGAMVDQATPPARLEARLSGCVEQRPQGACELQASRKLTVWMPVPAQPLRVEIDGEPIDAAQRTVQLGEQLHITVPAAAAWNASGQVTE